MRAVKDNQQYTISEIEAGSFQREGFDILDDKGNIVAYGAGKTVPIGKYVELQKKVEKLEKELRKAKKKED